MTSCKFSFFLFLIPLYIFLIYSVSINRTFQGCIISLLLKCYLNHCFSYSCITNMCKSKVVLCFVFPFYALHTPLFGGKYFTHISCLCASCGCRWCLRIFNWDAPLKLTTLRILFFHICLSIFWVLVSLYVFSLYVFFFLFFVWFWFLLVFYMCFVYICVVFHF